MTHVIEIVALLATGFGLGRVHHASQLFSKVTAFEATAVGDAKAAYAKIKSIL
jgi:hypothetical protein